MKTHMIKKKSPDSNVPQVLDISGEKDFLKITLILPAKDAKPRGKSKVMNYSILKQFPTGYMIGDENNPKELLLDARLFTNS